MNTGNVRCFAVDGSHFFAGTWFDGFYRSTDDGMSWSSFNSGLSDPDVFSLVVNGTYLFAGTHGGGVFFSTNDGSSWTQRSTGLTNLSVFALARRDTILFAGTAGGGVFLSPDSGTNWSAVNSGLTNTYVYSLLVDGTNLFVGTGGGGVFLSTNNGGSWTAASSGLTNTVVFTLAVSGANLFAGTLGGGVFISTNNGSSWAAASNGLTDSNVYALLINGSTIYAGTAGGGVFLSTNNGTEWSSVNSGLLNTNILSLAVSGSVLFAGTDGGGIYRTEESALPVEMSGMLLTVNGTSVIITWRTETEIECYGFELQRRTLNESSAQWNNIGFVAGSGTSTNTRSYSFTDDQLTPGRYGYRIKQIDSDGGSRYYSSIEAEVFAPSSFALEQNYPNPFNPSTTIRYQVPEAVRVMVRVYNVMGQLIETLVDTERAPGFYDVRWSPRSASSGVYFYRISAGAFTQIRKMVITR